MDKLYDTLCKVTQWTALTESILNSISVRVGDTHSGSLFKFLNIPTTFPYCVCGFTLPNSNSGYVYMLISTKCPEQTYVGTTINVAVRLNQHKSGFGSEGTAWWDYLPWAMAVFMTNMGHMSKGAWMSLENLWQGRNKRSVLRGDGSIDAFLNNGKKLYVITMKAKDLTWKTTSFLSPVLKDWQRRNEFWNLIKRLVKMHFVICKSYELKVIDI